MQPYHAYRVTEPIGPDWGRNLKGSNFFENGAKPPLVARSAP